MGRRLINRNREEGTVGSTVAMDVQNPCRACWSVHDLTKSLNDSVVLVSHHRSTIDHESDARGHEFTNDVRRTRHSRLQIQSVPVRFHRSSNAER